jgi:type IV pilus assembly protein PilX
MKKTTYCQVGNRRQRGISLITVLVILLLSLMAVMGAFRVANLNETILGSTADYNRAREAAEALIRDAEIDINGRRPPYTTVNADGKYGNPCLPAPAANATYTTEGCRTPSTSSPPDKPWFPTNSEDFDTVGDIVTANSATEHCQDGICVPLNLAEHAHIEDNLGTMAPLGAKYGQFTRQLASDVAIGVSGNPILQCPSATTCGWYWVELFRLSESLPVGPAAAAGLIPDGGRPFVFRITAVALGLKPGTRVVLTSSLMPFPKQP